MSLLVETIRAEDGKLLNVVFHNERLIKSLYGLFGLRTKFDLEKLISIPETAKKGIFKCRVEYDRDIKKIEFLPYTIKQVKSLKLIEDNEINYSYKFADRTAIDRLMANRGECDDILIVKDGYVTDSSYANVVLRDLMGNWVTPLTYLLPGTRRASMLRQGLITETKISFRELNKYTELKLINAMIGFDDAEGIPVGKII